MAIEYPPETEDAQQIARDIRDETTEICIRSIESLKTDNQGFKIDNATVDHCIFMLRSLKTMSGPANDKGDNN